MRIFGVKTFDETWDLLKRRHARVFDEELWNVPDHDLPSKTETYKIVKDCCFHYKWHLPLYDVVVADYGVHAETFASKLASRLEAVGAACRASKVRCEPERPCARCIKHSRQDSCVSWREGGAARPDASPFPAASSPGHDASLEQERRGPQSRAAIPDR